MPNQDLQEVMRAAGGTIRAEGKSSITIALFEDGTNSMYFDVDEQDRLAAIEALELALQRLSGRSCSPLHETDEEVLRRLTVEAVDNTGTHAKKDLLRLQRMAEAKGLHPMTLLKASADDYRATRFK